MEIDSIPVVCIYCYKPASGVYTWVTPNGSESDIAVVEVGSLCEDHAITHWAQEFKKNE